MKMTKPNIKAVLGFETDTELAAFFSVTKMAVSKWGDSKEIPQLRQLQLRDFDPKKFKLSAPKMTANKKRPA